MDSRLNKFLDYRLTEKEMEQIKGGKPKLRNSNNQKLRRHGRNN